MRTQTKFDRKKLTQEQKRNYCLQWQRSGQSKAVFCQSHGIAKSAFYAWLHQFKLENSNNTAFSPVTLKASPTLDTENVMHLEICLANQTKILIQMQKSKVISFIQELNHAIAAVQ